MLPIINKRYFPWVEYYNLSLIEVTHKDPHQLLVKVIRGTNLRCALSSHGGPAKSSDLYLKAF